MNINFAARALCGRIAFLIWALALFTFTPPALAMDDTLDMGVFPRRNSSETQKAFGPMVEHLSKKLGRPVRLVTSKDFGSFWKAVEDQRFDIVHYNQYHYIRSAQNYQVVAHIEEFGKSTIAGAIYVRKDSGITALSQLRGRTIIFGGSEDAMVSYIATRYMLQRAGVAKKDYKSLFAINPPNAIVALKSHQADAAGAGDGVIDMPEVRRSINTDEVKKLAVSPALLQLPIAVRRDMPPELGASIQSILVELKDSDEGRQILKVAALTGMGKAEDKDYEPHRKIVSAVLGPSAAGAKRVVRGQPSSGPQDK